MSRIAQIVVRLHGDEDSDSWGDDWEHRVDLVGKLRSPVLDHSDEPERQSMLDALSPTLRYGLLPMEEVDSLPAGKDSF